jgi:GT2 family glycosyltransferase
MPFSEANNYALINGGMGSEYVCFLNQDTISREDWLSACLEVMNQDEQIGAVIPLIENYEGTAWDEAFVTCARANPDLYARVQQGVEVSFHHLPAFIEVPEITAAAMVVRTEALKKAGPFDPIYGSYYEDYDLCRRIAAAGYKVGICTRGRVGHYGGSVTTDKKAYRRRARWICRNRVIYAARWKWSRRSVGFVRYIIWEAPRNLARSVVGRSSIPLRSFLQAHFNLVPLLPRLISERRDRSAWQKYLREIGWPSVIEQTAVGVPQAAQTKT